MLILLSQFVLTPKHTIYLKHPLLASRNCAMPSKLGKKSYILLYPVLNLSSRHLHESQVNSLGSKTPFPGARTPGRPSGATPGRPGGATPGHASTRQVGRTPNPYGAQTPYGAGRSGPPYGAPPIPQTYGYQTPSHHPPPEYLNSRFTAGIHPDRVQMIQNPSQGPSQGWGGSWS